MVAMGPVSGQAITLANSIIGVGILAMPFCFKQCGIVLSIFILIGSGLMSRLACHFLLKSAIFSRRKNFESLAYHVFGSAGKFAVEVGIIGFLMGTCIAYFVVVGDLGPQIVAKMFDLNQSNALRTGVMVIVSLVCVLPLGLLRNVDSLSNVCAATIGFYFCLVLKILSEAAHPLLTGEWVNKVQFWEPSGVLQCLPIFSMALFCQTQLFEIYDTLPNATLEKMNYVTRNAVNICSVVYVLVGLFGYIAFCTQPISGNILVSFSPSMGSDAIKMGFVMSLAFSFPLIIFPCRASLYSLLYRKGQASSHELLNHIIPDVRFKCLTIGIIAISLVVGIMLPNIELVLGLVGSTIGVMICVIFPATCFICISTKNTNERILAQIVLGLGIIIMVLGTYANLQAAEIESISIENKMIAEMNQNINLKEKISSSTSKHIHDTMNNQVYKNVMPLHKDKMKEKNILSHPPEKTASKVTHSKGDSKIQPPNPIPPKEEQSKANSKIKEVPVVKDNIQTQKNYIKIETIKEDKVEGAGDSEVQIELNTKNKDKPQVVQDTLKIDNSSAKNEKITHDISKDQIEDEVKKNTLMDTIKRHAEEQRQMVMEQKKILEEIKETKKDIEIKQKAEENKSAENKKLAVESIQKLAQVAIESLQGQINNDLTSSNEKQSLNDDQNILPKTIKEIVMHSKNEKDKNVAPKEKVIENNILPETIHVHKEDEPESYKAGEESEFMKKNVDLLNEKDKSNIMKRIPIAIALSKGKLNEKNENEVLKEIPKLIVSKDVISETEKILENSKKVINLINNLPNNIEEPETKAKSVENKEKKQDDYLIGKRDILGLRSDKDKEQEIISQQSDHQSYLRRKRDLVDCPGEIVLNNRGLQICEAHQTEKNEDIVDTDNIKNYDILKLSIKLSEPKNLLDPNRYLDNVNDANVGEYYLRNLKSVNSLNTTR